ncbi:MAG: acyl-CoA dehydrogenase [Burkholderiaceae bacterium]
MTQITAPGAASLLDDEQRMLLDAARKWAERRYGFEQRQAALASTDGFSREHWREMAEMGWLGLGLPEACGGYGGALEAALVAEQLGGALSAEPWLANTGLAGPLLAALHAQGATAAAPLLSALAAGESMLALAAFERQGRHDAFDVATRALPGADGSLLIDGRKTLVLGGGAARTLLVLAREHGDARATDGLSLFAVPADAPGVHVRALPTYDGRQTADVALRGVRVPPAARLGAAGGAWSAVEAALDHATAMLCAECVGAMDRLIDMTREYVLARKQFGRTIASNQVIQHRLVDLWVAAQQARALTAAAVDALADTAPRRARAVSLAKAFVCAQGRAVGEDGVQLHGAIGMTDEYAVGHYYKRLAAAANLFGDEPWHLARLDALERSQG